MPARGLGDRLLPDGAADVLENLGGLDGDFFLYYEDVDLCRRARQRGWTVWHDPKLSAIHHHPLHARTLPVHLRLITRTRY